MTWKPTSRLSAAVNRAWNPCRALTDPCIGIRMNKVQLLRADLVQRGDGSQHWRQEQTQRCHLAMHTQVHNFALSRRWLRKESRSDAANYERASAGAHEKTL